MNKLSIATQEYKLKLWIDRILDCRNSGKLVKQWCAENEIGIKTYYYWMRKIKQEAFDRLPAEHKSRCLSSKEINPITSFVEIKPREERLKKSCSDAALILHIGSAVVEVQNSATNAIIESTLRALQKLC